MDEAIQGDRRSPPGSRRVSSAQVSQISNLRRQGSHSSASTIVSPVSPLASSINSQHDPADTGGSSISRLSTTSSGGSAQTQVEAKWLPYTLHGYFIWVPVTLSLALGLVVILLYWYSNKNNGLSPETSAMFGWKFAPTLIAVLYTQMTAMLFDDVKRTEPFARLARPASTVPSASRTILETPREWWTTLVHGFDKHRNGGRRSWIIILACVVNVLAFLLISPLSSALLDSEEVNISRSFEVARLVPKVDSMLSAFAERDTYFRTTGALLQNVTTSAWISDDYSVLPFWPSGTKGSPWDRRSASYPQTWQANTTIFRSNFQCSKLNLAATDLRNTTEPKASTQEFLASVRLESSDGCQYNLSFNASDIYFKERIISWADRDHFAEEGNFWDAGSTVSKFQPTYNDKCDGNEAIIISSPWLKNLTAGFLSNLTISGQICSSTYSMATIPVVASISDTVFDIDFDRDLFRRAQQTVPSTLLNSSQLLEMYISPEWYSYIPSPGAFTGPVGPGGFSGVSALLGTQYGFNWTKMMDDAGLPEKAARIRRRFFGELLRTSLGGPGASQNEAVTGERTAFERRITVRLEAASVLSALFFVSFLGLLFVTWLSRARQRPLNLVQDPATVLGIASLVVANPDVLSSMRELDQSTKSELKSALANRYCTTTPGRLQEFHHPGQPVIPDMGVKTSFTDRNRSPFVLRLRILLGLASYFVLLIVAITVIHIFANRSSLRQALFTYQVNLDTLGHLGNFAPFSIIPTFLAIVVGLWWDGLDKTFRSLQPYASMSKSPTEISRGAGVTYQSSYWLWAATKAAKNKHWLLSLVTLGSFVGQIFIVSMSALFDQTTGIIYQPVNIERTLELRQMPHLRQVDETYPPVFDGTLGWGVSYVGDSLVELFTNLSTNWMYSAVMQASMNGPEPAWSRDEWSFLPVDLSNVQDDKDIQNKSASDTHSFGVYIPAVNITVTTPAIRGRVKCNQIEEVNNSTYWLEQWNLTDPRTNRTSEVTVPKYTMFYGTDHYTPIAPDAQYLSCCYNQTDPSRIENHTMPISVGYWTSNYVKRQSMDSITGTSANFTVKWLYGDGGIDDLVSSSPTLLFPEKPGFQALDCMPIIETSQAEIVVDKQSGRILSYRVLQDPVRDDGAWSDSFVLHDATDPDHVQYTSNTTALQNLTTSYGVLFVNSLLRASRLSSLSDTSIGTGSNIDEHLDDNVFNIRNNQTGLNLDFMSYASYVQVGRNASALLDLETLLSQTEKTFSTFFQHYVSSSVSLQSGGWAYQSIGETAKMEDLGPPVNGTRPQIAPGGQPTVNVSALPSLDTQRTTTATMATRVEVLRVNTVAFWISLALLIWLMCTTIIVAALQRWYFGDLNRNVESIADVLVLISGSERLLALVRGRGAEALLKDNVRLKLGWFTQTNGRKRWAIEVVEDGEMSLMNINRR